MPLVEKLGSFYLGREYDPVLRQTKPSPVDYDSRHLTTHAVCVGMTGSGKTGLCIDLLEEAAIDGVPAIILDPKGDITNLLLAFPELRPEDFLPWINPEDAERAGQSPEAFAAQAAETWREGLAAWDQGPERIGLLKEAAEFAIYTPGSEAGLPVSILSSFKAPGPSWDGDAETLRDRVQGTVSALLGLVGVEADPLKSREHILLANIVERAWRAGEDLDLPELILAVQHPPFAKLGVFDVDTLFPAKDRMALALALNNIIASPGFESWLAGEPLDIGGLLHDRSGKPRHSIFYIAHLSDEERMFFVTLLLENLLGWMRSQPGTTSLRALFYMDEVFGFFPPLGSPPSKRLLLTLLKQARAFGLGMLLATQNPADLDYKGLSNAGTWFVGKLQTERDKTRLMEGLLGALDENGVATDKGELERTIAGLESRAFLLHNVHAGRPITFQTRWAMSYLRGPLTRQQIRELTAGERELRQGVDGKKLLTGQRSTTGPEAGRAARAADGESTGPRGRPAAQASGAQTDRAGGVADRPPEIAAGIGQVWLPVTMNAEEALRQVAEHAGVVISPAGQRLVYEAAALGLAGVRFTHEELGFDTLKDYACLTLLAEQGPAIEWNESWSVAPESVGGPDAAGMRGEVAGGAPGALFRQDLHPLMADANRLKSSAAGFTDYLYRRASYSLLFNPDLRLYARPAETERDFRARCRQAAREARDAAVDELAGNYRARLARLEERHAGAQKELARAETENETRQHPDILGPGSLIGALGLFGRRADAGMGQSAAAATSQGPAAAFTNYGGRQFDSEALSQIGRIRAEAADAQRQMKADAETLTERWSQAAANVQALRLTPGKAGVEVRLMALAWAGSWEIEYVDVQGKTRVETVPAYPLA